MKKWTVIFAFAMALFVLLPTDIYAKSEQGLRSPQQLYLDNQPTELRGYNINDYNYYRLRDLAALLEGKVDFNAEGAIDDITIYKNTPYVHFSSDVGATSQRVTAIEKNLTIQIIDNGQVQIRNLKAYNIDGFNYFRLRDVGEILGFGVDYDGPNNRALVMTNAEQPEPRGRVILGNERLFSEYSHLIDGKKVGLITNQTGVDAEGTPIAQKLKNYPKAELIALYSPEHGLDGKQPAGEYVSSYFDNNLGLPVYSIYGQTRKPTPEMLKGVDVLLYDMQDIGSRTYTYISTLNYAMIAAKENGIPIVVLDRPNPLGGNIVEGFLRETRFKSFVGIDKMPMAHGMTAGELGQFFNREIKADLTVIPLKNWTRDMVWPDTGLVFGQTSPNIPDLSSAFLYMATGSGEGTGIGQSDKFHWVGGKNLDSNEYARRLNAANLPGVRFHASPRGTRGGVSVKVTDFHTFNPARTGVYTLAIANQMRPITVPELKKPYHMFYLIQGSETIAQMFRNQASPESIVAAYQKDVEQFKAQREPYLLYR
ncbi:DUF1343 domain-containing protein [Peptoniphilus sp. KCTC 25270]|uniref:DUF1343 domain-containing protein n=1 Tax=Peptoniphilus sp. KCTC 25270 TaxID=2897414 RepID=UPI001E332571|nr:DUF1343 domain-containing protein [Peptoniphilus sp. KCTC 25270]MCD1147769.1 DUF1343 domain-containing protein [Peptoniphilus sp. KCTC 25270]